MECLPLIKIKQKMEELKDWSLDGSSITKEKQLPDFKSAIEYINKIAVVAEEIKHHPDIFLSENLIRILCSTKESNCITEKDFELAKKINEVG